MNKYKDILIAPDTSIFEALKVIERQNLQIALIVNTEGKLLGSLTDGDIRRGILAGITLQDRVDKIMNHTPITVGQDKSRKEILRLMQDRKITRIPIIDDLGRVIDLKSLDQLIEVPKNKSNTVILMAGGLGSRLGELTENCPKPMLKVGSKPILEIILGNFIEYGFVNFQISVNYKAEMIEDYFKDGKKWGVNISYIREKQKMGTAGSLTLLENVGADPLIVMNGDLLTKVNFAKLIEHHEESGSMATMCVRQYDFQVPYGVVDVDGHQIRSITEKPVHSFFVNAGVYVLDPKCLKMIPDGEHYDMPDLFSKVLAEKEKSSVFPIHEYWLDIGRKDDFQKAMDEYPGDNS